MLQDYRRKKSSTSNKYSGSFSATNLQSTTVKPNSFRFELLAVALLIIAAGLYSYHEINRAFEFSTEKLFEKTFVEPIGSISDLKGGSKSIVGYDYWISFNSPAGATLRNASEFKPYIAEAGRSWFADKFPDDSKLRQSISHYEYFVRSKDTVGNIVNEGLLINKVTHDYYYRTWGI